ncbi:DUF4268 domain-containing protein [Flavobacterium sp.]|jgi:hypothetical protein|uniref:DUF4268 domain-containing protein n=1 Tax=Flavobacterium sp. TaxID=239 RepID=UPI0037C143C1
MYSREETQELKRAFWIEFAEKYPRKWLLYNTKIKDFTFKFFIDNKKAQVSIDIEPKDDAKRIAYFEKLESLKNSIDEEYLKDLVYEKNYYLENGKAISRIWVEKSGVSISNKSYWDEIFDFFNDKMNALELFYEQYDEYIKDI